MDREDFMNIVYSELYSDGDNNRANRIIDEWCTDCKEYDTDRHCCPRWNKVIRQTLADAQPEQPNLSEAYANAVFTWLMSYQIQSAQLKGRYTPYEVIGWVLNDWRKEHDAKRDT